MPAVLQLTGEVHGAIVAHAYDAFPLECCGLLVGSRIGGSGGALGMARAQRYVRSANLAESAKVYTLDPKVHLRAERDADDVGLEVIGVVHSHTHTDAFPSPTDIRQAPDPTWRYVIVSLRDDTPVVRSYRISDGSVAEEQIGVVR